MTNIGVWKWGDASVKTRFKTVVLDELPPYFLDLGPCLEKLWIELTLKPQLTDQAPTHEDLIAVLEKRLQEPFDGTVEELSATPDQSITSGEPCADLELEELGQGSELDSEPGEEGTSGVDGDRSDDEDGSRESGISRGNVLVLALAWMMKMMNTTCRGSDRPRR